MSSTISLSNKSDLLKKPKGFKEAVQSATETLGAGFDVQTIYQSGKKLHEKK
jgi:formyltetrahydrofolate synthetase